MRLVEQLADEYEAEVYVNVIMSEVWSKLDTSLERTSTILETEGFQMRGQFARI